MAATTTTDHAGTPVAKGDWVRYHGSKAAKCRVALLKVETVWSDGHMDLIHDGAFPFRVHRVRPVSVTFDC